MDRTQNIRHEIESLKRLRKDYESLVSEPNQRDAIEAYHRWHEESCILFSRYFGDDSKEYTNFAYIDNSGNGFVLYSNYQSIRKDFCVLIDRLERGDLGKIQQSNIEQISKTQPSSKKANAFVLSDNKQTPKAPNLPEYQQDSMDEFFEDVKFLASFIGCNIFEVSQPKAEHLFYTKGRGCEAKGFYSSNGFTVLKGSVIAPTMVPSFNWKEKREKMLQEYTETESDKLVLTSDKTFSSPSTAADFCIGSSNNGWLVWKDKDGNTLDSVYRKQLE